nr:hypothetical protein [Tissierella sp.]
MKSKLFIKVLLGVLVLSFSLSTLSHVYAQKNLQSRSLFSWKSSEVQEGRVKLFQTMEDLNLNRLYQHFSRDLNQAEVETFLAEAEAKGIEVSFMDGSSQWALEKDAEHAIKSIERVIAINKDLDIGKQIKSILFDIEPYTLKEWDDTSKENIMKNFVQMMKLAYKKAKSNNIEVIVCIPYYYDTMGLEVQLEELIETGCDSVAIMNYYKKREAKHIKQEVEYADKYGKNVINIYEFKAPGSHGLIDKNTYFKDGIEAAEKSFKNILKELPNKDISIAFHDYRALEEVLKRDGLPK